MTKIKVIEIFAFSVIALLIIKKKTWTSKMHIRNKKIVIVVLVFTQITN